MKKLYVGNLPFTATEDAVRNLFAPHGTVEKLALINDRDTGRPRGFGFLAKPFAKGRVAREIFAQDLNRNRPLQHQVPRAVNHSHPA